MTSPNQPLFWTVTGADFGRSIAWARRQPNRIIEQIRIAQAAKKGTVSACPFCGDTRPPQIEEEKLELPDEAGDAVFLAVCLCCGASGPLANTREHALTLWNDRMPAGSSAEWRAKRQEETK